MKEMKSILISIKPEWVAKILNGEKTIEIRKTAPKCELPVEVYIYCAEKNGKVVAKFTLRKVDVMDMDFWWRWPPAAFVFYDENGMQYNDQEANSIMQNANVNGKFLYEYCEGKNITIYAWHISDLEIFDELMELSKFGLKKAPQNWQYIDK